jgi:hypothetical protein
MKKNITIFLIFIYLSSLMFNSCKKEIVQYNNLNDTGYKNIKVLSISQLNDSVYQLKIKSNFHISKSNLQIIRLDLNQNVLDDDILEFYNDSIFEINFNVKKFIRINDLTNELKYNATVDFRAYFKAIDITNNIYVDKIDFSVLWKVINIGGFQLKVKPNVFYNFSELSLFDFMGRGEKLVAPYGLDWTTDRFGHYNSAVFFTKSNASITYLKYNNPANPVIYYNDFTVSFWAKPSRISYSSDDNFLIHPGVNSSNGIKSIGASIGVNQINIQSHVNGIHMTELSFDYDFKDWTQITFRVSGGVIYLFINGVFIKSTNFISSNLCFSLASCQIYKNSGLGISFDNVDKFSPYQGLFDDYMIFTSALTNVEILDLYNQTK